MSPRRRSGPLAPSVPAVCALEARTLEIFLETFAQAIRRPPAPPLPLKAFVQAAWPLLEPTTAFRDTWHIGFLCEHLEAVHRGEIVDLLINLPPASMKSLLVSVLFPAWEWTCRPELRYLCGSYDQQLAIRDNRRMRQIVESWWYQDRWPLALCRYQNTKTRFDNDKSGWRMGTSVGGRATGEHPHRKIIDDPHNVKQSLSAAARTEALTWFDLTMGARGVALGAATVIIMQRLHQNDLSGHVLESLPGQFVHICLPMRYEPPVWIEINGQRELVPRMHPTPLGLADPRTRTGRAALAGSLRRGEGRQGRGTAARAAGPIWYCWPAAAAARAGGRRHLPA